MYYEQKFSEFAVSANVTKQRLHAYMQYKDMNQKGKKR